MLSKKPTSTIFNLLIAIGLFCVMATQVQTQSQVHAQTFTQNKVNLYFFWGNGCPHCADEKNFLEKIQKDYPTLTINKYEVWNNSKNKELLKKVGKVLNTDVRGVPFTVIGSQHVVGYYTDATTGEQIRRYIDYCLSNTCIDIMDTLNSKTPSTSSANPNPQPTPDLTQQSQIPPIEHPNPPKQNHWNDVSVSLPKEVSIPIIGPLNLATLSLPLIAVVLGALDGFNPCAMWVLLFLISLLVNLPNKNRRWLLGISFLLASGLVYFFFMAAWLNILLFVGFIFWIRLSIAIFAVIAGCFSLNKFLKNRTGCQVTNNENRKETFEKLKKYAYDKSLLTALLGIIGLAFAVNLVELLCSAGFPAIFTQILALNNLSGMQYYLYIALYIVFFMLDDLIIFFLAMWTLEVTGISTKYAKYSNLIGGILMLTIGTLLIFKPEYLMFNF